MASEATPGTMAMMFMIPLNKHLGSWGKMLARGQSHDKGRAPSRVINSHMRPKCLSTPGSHWGAYLHMLPLNVILFLPYPHHASNIQFLSHGAVRDPRGKVRKHPQEGLFSTFPKQGHNCPHVNSQRSANLFHLFPYSQ